MPAWADGGHIGIKMVTVFPNNGAKSLPSIYGTYTLLDGETGIPLATMDGSVITLFRTAAASVLAATYLARTEASRLVMIGTGALAPHIIATYVEVLGIKEVQIWGRNGDKAAQLVQQLSDIDAHITATTDIEAACNWADVISCATLSKDPLIKGDWLSPGTFVDLIGAYTPEMREADDGVISKSSIFVDTREGALKEAGEIMIPIQKGIITEKDILGDLFDLTLDKHPGRLNDAEITLFKSSGFALEDLVAAQMVFEYLSQ